jgi:hypothetical protein
VSTRDLGFDPAKFRAYLKAEIGEKAADLATVAPGLCLFFEP